MDHYLLPLKQCYPHVMFQLFTSKFRENFSMTSELYGCFTTSVFHTIALINADLHLNSCKYNMHLLRQESFVCIFESPLLVALFNSACTDEMVIYNLNKVVHAFVMHIDGLS